MVLLPDPDSPTMPMLRPAVTASDTPLSACTTAGGASSDSRGSA